MKKVYILLLTALVVFMSILFYINLRSPIKIALVGNFQEERYNFSTSSIIAGRIAEEDINYNSGVRGKKTQLIVRNDDFKDLEDTIQFLKENKIEAIITTASSQDILKLKPYLDKNKIICFSVGATSSELNMQDDYIYRLVPDDKNEVKAFYQYIVHNNLSKDIVLIYNKSNLKYKKSIEENIKNIGFNITFEDEWEGNSVNYTPRNVESMKDKTILVLSSSRDTAFVVQKLNINGIRDNIFGLSWSGDDNLLSYGGKAIDGFKFITPVDLTQPNGEYKELTKKLNASNKSNGLIPKGVYEAYGILKEAYIDKYEKHITLKQAIDSSKEYQGLSEKIIFDKFGDAEGEEFIFTVINGQFTRLGGSYDESTKN